MIDCFAAEAEIHPCELTAGMGHEPPLMTGCFVAFQSEQVKQAGLLLSLYCFGASRLLTVRES